jgi:hypothetical protein
MYSTRDSHPLQLSDDAKTPKCRGLCAPGRAHCRIARAREPTPGDTEIATDGSDVKESSVVVPKRSLQFEDGTTWTRDQKDQNIDFSQTSFLSRSRRTLVELTKPEKRACIGTSVVFLAA